jgi:short-subunit dehydrogenase
VAIVTGASSGIGEATAKCLARAGYQVVLAARRADLLDALAQEIQQAGGKALAVPTDLADGDATAELLQGTLQTFGSLDLIVNNAGYSPIGALEQLTRDQVRHTFEVNLFSGLQLIAEAIPIYRKQGHGRIINIGSLTSRFPAPLAVAYAGTKGGMEAAMNCLRLEARTWNIHFSMVIPGFVDTPAFETAKASGEELRNDPSNLYQQLMFDLEEFANGQLKNAASSDQVAEAVLKVARAEKPKAYTYVPFSSTIIQAVMRFLPARLIDAMLCKLYKVPARKG